MREQNVSILPVETSNDSNNSSRRSPFLTSSSCSENYKSSVTKIFGSSDLEPPFAKQSFCAKEIHLYKQSSRQAVASIALIASFISSVAQSRNSEGQQAPIIFRDETRRNAVNHSELSLSRDHVFVYRLKESSLAACILRVGLK